MPGVQKPHCEPWQSTMACCTGCKLPSVRFKLSTVLIDLPSRDGSKWMQLLIGR